MIIKVAKLRFPTRQPITTTAAAATIATTHHTHAHTLHGQAELVILGGAFFVNGNVSPASEANIYGDPEAADVVFGVHPNVRVVGLDVTNQVTMTGQQLEGCRGRGRFGTLLADMSKFYLQFYTETYNREAIIVHDPTALAAVLRPDLFTWRRGAIRVCTEGIARGHTIVDGTLSLQYVCMVWRSG